MESDEDKTVIRAYGSVDVVCEKRMVTLEWIASPVNDLYADAILCVILQAEGVDVPKYIPANAKVDKIHFKVKVSVIFSDDYIFAMLLRVVLKN